ncbi:MAG: LapA family protein [Crocosphaera sp.]
MRLILGFLMLIATIILLVQNQQMIALGFLGTEIETALFSLKLPLGLWVILFTLAGILTSLLIQVLTRLPRQVSPTQTAKPRPRPQDPPETPYQRPETKKSDWESTPPPEWENVPPEDDYDDEWDIEQPPIEKTVPRRPSRVEETRSEFEVQQPPKTASQEGTVYSYTYGELSDRISATPPPDPPKVEKKPSSANANNANKKVYDADYRVITPPYRTPQRSDDEEEESWI